MTARFELVVQAASALVDGAFRPAWIAVTGGVITVVSHQLLTGDTEVTLAADRPNGLIGATILRDDAPDAGQAWRASAGLA
jgi:hypothetical protein